MDVSSNERILAMHDLMEEVIQIQKENSKDPTSVERIRDIIIKSSKLVENSDSANEIIMDAKILHTGSHVLTTNVSSFDTHLTSFNEEEYEKGLLLFVRSNSVVEVLDKSWSCLAPQTYHLFRRSQPVTSMVGLVSFEPAQVVEAERERQERRKKVVETMKTRLSEAGENSENRSEDDSNIYKHILQSLVMCYRANGKRPVEFIDFVIDPESYWQTVENIFYFSFLVREGSVSMYLSDGVPVVEPVSKSSTSGDRVGRKDTCQFSFSLGMDDWRRCIKRFRITSAKIKPFRKNS